jgi:hypothetical protein
MPTPAGNFGCKSNDLDFHRGQMVNFVLVMASCLCLPRFDPNPAGAAGKLILFFVSPASLWLNFPRGAFVYRLGHGLLKAERGVRFPYALPFIISDLHYSAVK